jgi:RNA polymerase sigma factor (sigma-70 family)
MDYSEMDDEKLVRYLRKHTTDDAGWMVLLERYDRLIWSYLPRNDPDAQDLHQEIQIAIRQGLLERFSGEKKVISYIGGVIRNKVLGRYRMKTRETLDTEYDQLAPNLADTRPTPEQQVLQQEAAVEVEKLLNRLKPKEQQVLILRYFGYDHKEIARIVGIRSDGASRRFLNKFKPKIPKFCQQLDIDPEQFKEGLSILCEEGKLHEILDK